MSRDRDAERKRAAHKFALYERVAFDQSGPRSATQVVVALFSHPLSEDEAVWPSISKLATRLGITRQGLQNVLRWLEAAGHITCEIGAGPGGKNVFRIAHSPPTSVGTTPPTSVGTPRQREFPGVPTDVSQAANGSWHNSLEDSSIESEGARKRASQPSFDEDLGIDPEVANDFRQHRKALRKPLTDGAMKLLNAELRKLKAAGRDPNDGLREAMLRGWQAVKAEWLLKPGRIEAESRVKEKPWNCDAIVKRLQRQGGIP